MGSAVTHEIDEVVDNDAWVVVAPDVGDSVRTEGSSATMDDCNEHCQGKLHSFRTEGPSATMNECNEHAKGPMDAWRQCSQAKICQLM